MSKKLAEAKAANGEYHYEVTLKALPDRITGGGVVKLVAEPGDDDINAHSFRFWIQPDPASATEVELKKLTGEPNAAVWTVTDNTPRGVRARVEMFTADGEGPVQARDDADITVTQELLTADDLPPVLQGPTVPVSGSISLNRAASQVTGDQVLWSVIRDRTTAIGFLNYKQFIDNLLCANPLQGRAGFDLRLPFPGVAAYAVLKAATEMFLMQECGVVFENTTDPLLISRQETEESARLGRPVTRTELEGLRRAYLADLKAENAQALPYFDLIRQRLAELAIKPADAVPGVDCYGILRSRFTAPCMIELIWSYWHEEGMLAQTMNAISYRFQNKRIVPGNRDPLAHFDIDPLRGLSNFLWGYVQDEQHRLGVLRRAYEYDHQYGLRLYGKAVQNFDPVDSRSKFLEAFHNLLYRAALFYERDDDTTIIADGFEVLNALREVHLILSYGAHNQFGDLPSNARQEMLIEQWLLARPEMREFLGGKPMVAYTEPWMDRVDTVKSMFGWMDSSVTYFHDLAVNGEQIVLSVRYGNWTQVNDMAAATNWARYWRPEIQRYIHAYRAVTGVDLGVELVDSGRADERYVQPSIHLRNRLAQQRGGGALPPGDRRALGPGVSAGQAGESLAVRNRNR
ncbi:MAG TPA: hypothetical protein VF064_08350 [Pyrinomonadaceae bacterium]